MYNEINFFQTMNSSMMSNQLKPKDTGAGMQSFRQGAMPNNMPNSRPFMGDASRMSREAAGGMNPFLQANTGTTGAFFEGLMNMLMQNQNAGGRDANQNLLGARITTTRAWIRTAGARAMRETAHPLPP